MQDSKLYVGNLEYSTTNDELQGLFESYGNVEDVKIIEGKGFGFITLGSPEEARSAKEELNGKEFKGRNIRVDAARPPKRHNNRYRRNY